MELPRMMKAIGMRAAGAPDVLRLWGQDLSLLERRARIARRLFELLAPLHGLWTPALAPLEAAAYFQDTGTLVDPEQRANAVEVMDRQLDHLVRLVDDLLDVSRITTGKLELRTESVKIANALRHAVERVTPEIAASFMPCWRPSL